MICTCPSLKEGSLMDEVSVRRSGFSHLSGEECLKKTGRRAQTTFRGERWPKTGWNLVLRGSGEAREIVFKEGGILKLQNSCKSWNEQGSCIQWQILINDPRMFNLEFTITLPLFLLFLSQLPPPIWDCRSFCFSQILCSLTFLLTCHTSIAISWISAELSAKVRRKLEGNSPNILSPQTYTLPGSTHPSKSFLEHSYARKRHWNYHR